MLEVTAAKAVRTKERQDLLDRMKIEIAGNEARIERLDLYRTLLQMILLTLIMDEVEGMEEEVMRPARKSDVSPEIGREIVGILDEIAGATMSFQQTQEEGRAIWADLFVWVAQQLARPYQFE